MTEPDDYGAAVNEVTSDRRAAEDRSAPYACWSCDPVDHAVHADRAPLDSTETY